MKIDQSESTSKNEKYNKERDIKKKEPQGVVGQLKDNKGPHLAIVLLHGLGQTTELNKMETFIKDKFGNKVLIIYPKCRNGDLSKKMSIEKQARAVSKDISTDLKDNNLPGNFPILIIGYSQGGVVTLLLADDYSELLNIRRIIPICTPVHGVPLLKRGVGDAVKFCWDTHDELSQRKVPFGSMVAYMIGESIYLMGCRWSTYRPLRYFSRVKGIMDLHPDSSTIQKVAHFLNKESPLKPKISLLGAYYEDLGAIITTDKLKMPKSTKALAKLVTEDGGYNDTLLPTSGHLGIKNDKFNEYMSNPGAFNQPNIERIIYKETVHYKTVVPMGLPVVDTQATPVASCSEKVFDTIKEIILKELKEIKKEKGNKERKRKQRKKKEIKKENRTQYQG